MITARKDSSNPVPFRRPYLCLMVRISGREEKWFIDVEGQTHKYLESKSEGRTTGRLAALCRLLASKGILVANYGTYAGEASATHILRDGFLFSRMPELDCEGSGPVDFADPVYKSGW